MKPEQHPLGELYESYTRATRVIATYRSKMSRVFEVWAAQKLVEEFENKALDALVEVSGHAIEVAERKHGRGSAADTTDALLEKSVLEDLAHSYGSKFARRLKFGNGEFMNMETLLDEVIKTEAEILSRGSIQIPVRIFSPRAHGSISDGAGEWMSETRTAPKYESLVRVLSKAGINISQLIVAVEKLQSTQLRSIPYRVIWLQNPLRTICVSDEIGEKTYVYHGFVDVVGLSVHQKWEPINGVSAAGVQYTDNYESALYKAIFDEMEIEAGGKLEKPISSVSVIEKLPDPSIIVYQCELLAAEKELAEAGIFQIEGVWYFGDTKGNTFWPKINGKNLRSFPNTAFIKQNHIGKTDGLILNPTEAKKMFSALWLRVASEAEEIARWRGQIEWITEALAKAGIIQEEDVWYFGNAKNMRAWPNIHNRSLRSFPNYTFNQNHEIGNEDGAVQGITELKKMFAALGLRVATPEEEALLKSKQK